MIAEGTEWRNKHTGAVAEIIKIDCPKGIDVVQVITIRYVEATARSNPVGLEMRWSQAQLLKHWVKSDE